MPMRDSGLIVARGSASFGPISSPTGESSPEIEAAAKTDYLPAIRKIVGSNVAAEDVHIFQGLIANTKLISFGGQFTPRSIIELADLYAGAPVMFEHDYDQAPIGRFFAGERVFIDNAQDKREENYWAKVIGYLPANDAEGDAIYRRMKLKIFDQMSAAWAFASMTCSVCDVDMRRCGHWPLEIYNPGGIARFDMEGIIAVYEGSIVFQGAAQNTTITPLSASGAPRTGRASAYDAWRGRLEASHGSVATIEEIVTEMRGEAGAGSGDGTLASMFSETARTAGQDYPSPVRHLVVSVQLPKDRFDRQADAAAWARWRGFRVDQANATSSDWEFTQRSRDGLEEGADQEVALERKRADPVKAIVGKKKVAGDAQRASIVAADVDIDSLAGIFGG